MKLKRTDYVTTWARASWRRRLWLRYEQFRLWVAGMIEGGK